MILFSAVEVKGQVVIAVSIIIRLEGIDEQIFG
jgi:hypothetical protein